MRLEIVGKNGFNLYDSTKEYIEKKTQKIEKLLQEEEDLTVRIVCKWYKEFFKVEITIPTKTAILRSEEKALELNPAIDLAIEKVVNQIRRYHTKRTDIKKDSIAENFQNFQEEVEVKNLVREKEVKLEPMTRDEAIDQMELLGHTFFVYLDKGTHHVNVLYVRDDGDYAVIETK